MIPVDANVRFTLAEVTDTGTPWPYDRPAVDSGGFEGYLVPTKRNNSSRSDEQVVFAGDTPDGTDTLYLGLKPKDDCPLEVGDVIQLTAERAFGVWEELAVRRQTRYSVRAVRQNPGLGLVDIDLVRL